MRKFIIKSAKHLALHLAVAPLVDRYAGPVVAIELLAGAHVQAQLILVPLKHGKLKTAAMHLTHLTSFEYV